jgi:hypothetical protein
VSPLLLLLLDRLGEADDVYANAAVTAHGHDFGSYGKALAAMRSISDQTATQALQASAVTQCLHEQDCCVG